MAIPKRAKALIISGVILSLLSITALSDLGLISNSLKVVGASMCIVGVILIRRAKIEK